VADLGLADMNGILRLPWVRPDRSGAGLGWYRLYVPTQSESPYRASFGPAGTHLVILHLGGPVTVRRGKFDHNIHRTLNISQPLATRFVQKDAGNMQRSGDGRR
jgi:hypothetical protein